MANELHEAIDNIVTAKGVSKEAVIKALENALITAYKKEYGKHGNNILSAENVCAQIDDESGEFYVYAEKTVVDVIENGLLEIDLESAQELYPDCKIGDIVRLAPDAVSFGRIAAQGARSVFLQEIKEEERDAVYKEFLAKKHKVISGVIHKFNKNSISVTLGKADGILPKNEQVEGEHFHGHEHGKFYVLDVKKQNKTTQVFLSRKNENLIRGLFEEEIVEIQDGTVEIKKIAREAGVRSKVAVYSNDTNVDAIGACIGIAGSRINNITDELKTEKIDIIRWSDNAAEYIEGALSPANVISVLADTEEKSATVIVPDSQLSLAIGAGGLNVRLAAKLTGYKIDILNETQGQAILDEYLNGELI